MAALEVRRGADGKIRSISLRYKLSDARKLAALAVVSLVFAMLFHALPEAEQTYRAGKLEVLLWVLGAFSGALALYRILFRRKEIADPEGLVLPECGEVAWREVIAFRIASDIVGWALRVDLENAHALKRKIRSEAARSRFDIIATDVVVDLAALKAALEELRSGAGNKGDDQLTAEQQGIALSR